MEENIVKLLYRKTITSFKIVAQNAWNFKAAIENNS